MKRFRKSYYNVRWFEYSSRVKKRDNNSCVKCSRNSNEATLQVHHKRYVRGLEPWGYRLSDCITLCKGCHTEEHNLIEPRSGWTLIAINDLGGLDGICERKGCGKEIRYEHEAYHPNWGYKALGSSCIEFLTREDKWLSAKVLKVYKSISDFTYQSHWEIGHTKNDEEFLGTTYKHNKIRIYGKDKYYAFQVALKVKGESWYLWKDIIKANNKNLVQVKELAYLVVRGLTATEESEVEILRNIYKQAR